MDERQFVALDHEVPTPTLDSLSEIASPSGDQSQSLVAQMIRLNVLLYDIVLLNARIVAEQTSLHDHDTMPGSMAHQIVQALDDWANSLPPQLHYSDENVAYWVDEGLGPIFITLHINYNHAGQLLFYQYLHSAQNLEQGIYETGLVRVFAQKCHQHATNLCDLMYQASLRPETVVLYPLAGHILCLASTVQIHTLLFGVDDDKITAAKTRLSRNFEMISSMNNYWPMSHRSISRLQHFHNACMKSMDNSFRLDAWLLRFLLGFAHDIEEKEEVWSQGHVSSKAFDHLRNLLDV
jgi:hypothetical protein